MGVNLIMKKNDAFICNLGRSHNFKDGNYLNLKYDDVWLELQELLTNMKADILPIVGYTPKNKEDLDNSVNDVTDNLTYYAEEFQKLGCRLLIADMAKEEDIKFEEE